MKQLQDWLAEEYPEDEDRLLTFADRGQTHKSWKIY